MENKTKLKTLKDIWSNSPILEPFKKAVKQEAIKWVKEFRKQTQSITRFGKNTAAGLCYGFIQFFNITEEDLK